MSCGVTETMYGAKVAPTVTETYKLGPDAGAAAVAMRQLPTMKGGCGCFGGKPPKKTVKQSHRTGGIGGANAVRHSLRGGYGGCTGQPTMLRALGIMQGGAKTIRRSRGGACPCALSKLVRGGYRATARDRAALRKWRAGKSIGFTMRSSLKAKGLIPRANGTKRVSNKYK